MSSLSILKSIAKKILSIPIWETKCWGSVWHRFNDNIINESLLIVKENWQCSIHSHTNRYNAFISISAIIGIEVWDKQQGENIINIMPNINYILRPGSSFIVPPNTYHRFYTITAGKIIEIYWTNNGLPCSMNDINRLNIGGPRD